MDTYNVFANNKTNTSTDFIIRFVNILQLKVIFYCVLVSNINNDDSILSDNLIFFMLIWNVYTNLMQVKLNVAIMDVFDKYANITKYDVNINGLQMLKDIKKLNSEMDFNNNGSINKITIWRICFYIWIIDNLKCTHKLLIHYSCKTIRIGIEAIRPILRKVRNQVIRGNKR